MQIFTLALKYDCHSKGWLNSVVAFKNDIVKLRDKEIGRCKIGS